MIKMAPKIKKIIEENVVVFATANKKGNPHCIAVTGVKIVSKNQLLITDNQMQKTIKNVSENASVSLVAWNEKEECVKMSGKAKYYTAGPWRKRVQNMKENKGYSAKGAILIVINKLEII